MASVVYVRSKETGRQMNAGVAHHRVATTVNGDGYLKRTFKNLAIRVALVAMLLSWLPIR
jgi:hypothetical protein